MVPRPVTCASDDCSGAVSILPAGSPLERRPRHESEPPSRVVPLALGRALPLRRHRGHGVRACPCSRRAAGGAARAARGRGDARRRAPSGLDGRNAASSGRSPRRTRAAAKSGARSVHASSSVPSASTVGSWTRMRRGAGRGVSAPPRVATSPRRARPARCPDLPDRLRGSDRGDRRPRRPRDPGYVCAIAVHALMGRATTPSCARAPLRVSTLIVPDGRPLVWALNALGELAPDRVYGPELMRRYCERAPPSRPSHLALRRARRRRVLAQLGRRSATAIPESVIAGRPRRRTAHSTDAEDDSPRPASTPTAPDLVFVGLGAAEAGEVDGQHAADRLDAPVLVGVGAAFDFPRRPRKRQAPPWMQRSGLEWLFPPLAENRAGCSPATPALHATPRSSPPSRASTCTSGAAAARRRTSSPSLPQQHGHRPSRQAAASACASTDEAPLAL